MTQLIRRTPQERSDDFVPLPLVFDKPAAAVEYPFLLPPVEPDEIGRLGNYRVLRLLGAGGMGFVFHAEDLALKRPVALKVMKPDQGGNVDGWQRFLREARAMASIKHEALVTVFQVARENAVVFLAMELLQGESLEDWLEHMRQPDLPAILRVGQDVAGGLAAMHRNGLIHRDLKPANLWMETRAESASAPQADGLRVKILDFGLARFVKEDVKITRTGTVLGTPCYMSPEQARGEPADGRSDLFSFGCVLYCLCTGTNPFDANCTTAVLTALALHDPLPVHHVNPAIPKSLSNLVSRLLDKNPDKRPASAEEVLEQLRRIEAQPADSGQSSGSGRSSDRDATLRTPILSEPEDPYATRPLSPSKRTPAARKRSSGKRKRRPARRRWALVTLGIVLAVSAGIAGTWAGVALSHRSPRDFPHPQGAGDPVGQARVYLSALNPIVRENWPMLPPAPPGLPPFNPVGAMRVQGKEWSHGIFMHPPHPHEGSASLTYRLNKDFATFSAEVSFLDGPPPGDVPVLFAVYGDGRLLWRSRPLRSQADRQVCTLGVEGVDQLKIEVTCSGDPRGAHAVWIDPSLERASPAAQ